MITFTLKKTNARNFLTSLAIFLLENITLYVNYIRPISLIFSCQPCWHV